MVGIRRYLFPVPIISLLFLGLSNGQINILTFIFGEILFGFRPFLQVTVNYG